MIYRFSEWTGHGSTLTQHALFWPRVEQPLHATASDGRRSTMTQVAKRKLCAR